MRGMHEIYILNSLEKLELFHFILRSQWLIFFHH